MYPSAFAGISKTDIIEKSTKEVVLKIKNNLQKPNKKYGTIQENPKGSLFESKVSHHNSKIEPPIPASLQNYLTILKNFEDARRSYFTKMDRNSL